MWSLFVVIAHELLQNRRKMLFVNDDQVVKALTTKGAHYSLGDGICRRRSHGAQQGLCAKPLAPGPEITAIDAVAVTE